MSNKRAIGNVRPSQVITTFGPGAIVDLQTLSVIVAGIDSWSTHEQDAIHEPRLERALRVKGFFAAKPTEGSFFSRSGTVPSYLFPTYQVCPVCQTLSTASEDLFEYDDRWVEIQCKAPGCTGRGKFRATTLPAPFIVACPSGHIDDFPWREYVHRGPVTCRLRMRLYSAAQTGSIDDIRVTCECGVTRSASDAFGERRANALGPCSRKRPWLGPANHDAAPCLHANEVRAMQRGATNAWFSVTRSAIAIREAATPIGVALNACNPVQIDKIDTIDKLRSLIEMDMFPSLFAFPLSEVWAAICRQRGEAETEEIDLRWPEWQAFKATPSRLGDKTELFVEKADVPSEYKSLISSVVRVRKLLEVRALVGFTRVDSAGVGVDEFGQPNIAPISRSKKDWLPGVEIRGEGLFIELSEDSIAAWEARAEVRVRVRAMEEKYLEWERQRGSKVQLPFPGGRYVLIHTLAHALIRQVSLDCGYSASSIRERIFSSTEPARKMAGVLLYTGTPDSEGSLGGLVDLGEKHRFPGLLREALRSSGRCSSDPLCADHQPDVHATINGAACHACVLVSESSCETFNRFLDRNLLVPTLAHDELAYFPVPR